MVERKYPGKLITKTGAVKTYYFKDKKAWQNHPQRAGPRGARAKAQIGHDDFPRRRGAAYSTWFKATGTMGKLREMVQGGYTDLLQEELDDFPAPAAFYSNESALLGQVKWKGVRPLESLIGELNRRLQFFGEERKDFDFRLVYNQWSYKYMILEIIGGFETILHEERESKPRARRR